MRRRKSVLPFLGFIIGEEETGARHTKKREKITRWRGKISASHF